MLRKRTWYRIYCGVFLLLLVGAAFFGAYHGNPLKSPEQISADVTWLAAFQETFSSNDKFWVSFGTLIIAIFTAILGVGTAFLFLATRQLARGAEDTARRQLRAYVSSAPDYIFNFNPATVAQMRYTMRNHGQTPAYGLSHSAAVDIFPFPLPPNFDFPQLPPHQQSSPVLHQNDSVYGIVFASRNFDIAEINAAVANNGFRIYVFGTVRYMDAFGVRRCTRFCRSVIGSTNLAIVAGVGAPARVDIEYSVEAQHNEAD
jgi:hypothetical protein